MLTSADIQKISKVIELRLEAFGKRFYTKEEIDEKFSQILNVVDGIAQDNLIHNQEMTVLGFRIKRTENWIDKAAPKIGLKFKH